MDYSPEETPISEQIDNEIKLMIDKTYVFLIQIIRYLNIASV